MPDRLTVRALAVVAVVAAALALAACETSGRERVSDTTTTTASGLATTTRPTELPTSTTTSPDPSMIEVTPTSARANEKVLVRGRGFCPLLAIRVDMRTPEGAPDVPILGNVDTDGGGSFELTAVVPDEFGTGPHVISAQHHRVPGREDCLERSTNVEIHLR